MNHFEFYNLKEQPFSLSVDDRFYFNSTPHARALTKLRHALDERMGLAVLVGETGTGKTTLARRLLEEMEDSIYEAALLVVIHPTVTAEWVLRKIAAQLGIEGASDDRNTLISQLYRRLVEIDDAGKKAAVLVDEAHMLRDPEIMEELRGILNMEPEGHKLMTFVLFGMPEMDAHLARCKALKQCVAVRCQIRSFSQETTEEYIRYRLEIAGSKKNLFSKGTYEIIHRYSGGTPRLINTICDNALLEGFLLKKPTLDEDLVREVVADLALSEADGAVSP